MNFSKIKVLSTPLILAVLIAGCSGLAKNQALLDAEGFYNQAKQDENVLRHAPTELQRAEEALQKAASASSREDMTSMAYVATTRTQTAMSVAERKVAREKLKELNQLRSEERLKARDLEISQEKNARKRAQMEREAALADAEASRLARESALADAETLRSEREAALAEAEALRAEKEETRKAAEALRLEMQALQAVKTERGMVMTLGDVLFSTGKAQLQAGAMSTIERLSEFLAEYTDKTVLIEGHTDNVGADQYNQALSEKRAESVQNALLQLNVDPQRIDTIGYGESRPLADNGTDAGRLKNRRVEIVIQD